MSRRLTQLGALLAFLLVPGGGRDALEGEQARPIRVIAEAEDFRIERGWSVVPFRQNYFASTFAISFLSRMACLGAAEQLEGKAVASLGLRIPEAAAYEVLVRYEQPWNFSAEFDLEVEQGGRVVHRASFGRLGQPRIWAFGGDEVPMKRFTWGGTDNIVWQRGGSVRLDAGAARLRLLAGAQREGDGPRARAARRHVDAIVLTNDTARTLAAAKAKRSRHLPLDGWLVQDGDLFARFTNPKDAQAPVIPVVEGYPRGQHSPWAVHLRDWPRTLVLRSGRWIENGGALVAGPRSDAVDPVALAPLVSRPAGFRPDAADSLAPGESSGWVPLGAVLDSMNDSQWLPRVIYPSSGRKEKRKDLDLEIELAIPDGRRGLRPIRKLRLRGIPDHLSPVTLVIPGRVRDQPRVRTQLEAVEELARAVAAFPKRGSAPRRFPIYGLMGFSGVVEEDWELGRAATQLALALGDNTLTPTATPWARELGIPERRTRLVKHWPLERLEKGLAEARSRGTAGEIAAVSFGDEKRVGPGQVESYVAATRHLEQELGAQVRTGMNYSPHANYMVDATDFIAPFRRRALTLPWSEDYVWQVPEVSVQVTGYLVSGFRAGARAENLPILMYAMPHSPGNTPRDFRLSFYTAVAHGARLLHVYCASPLSVGNTENYIADDDLGMWRAVHDAVHDVGSFEDYVLEGRVRPARVGLLLSPEDERLTGDTNRQGGIHNQERKAVYYALRHAQVPVDFVAEDDFREGRAPPLDLLYVTQQYLHSKTVAALKRFAEAGGTVVALVGGGFLDESGARNAATGALYGVADQALFKDRAVPMVLAKQDLPGLPPLDRARIGDVEIPALVWKQAILPSNGRVIGRFGDGTAAVVEKVHGKGRAVLFGFFPGMAYLQSGLPLRPVDRAATDAGFNHFLPTAMDVRIRQVLVDAFLPPSFVRPVEASAPLVEATLIEARSPRRVAVPLMNFGGTPLPAVTVTLRGLGKWSHVRSVERGALAIEAQGDDLSVTLPLDVADMLLFDAER